MQIALWMLAVQFPEPRHTAFRFPRSVNPFRQVSRQVEPGDAGLFPQAGGDSEMFFRVVMGGQRTSGGNECSQIGINLIYTDGSIFGLM